jgi:tryptophan synthase alpha subunit
VEQVCVPHHRHTSGCADKVEDIIELGLPFTDPIADGPTIQKSNTVRVTLC